MNQKPIDTNSMDMILTTKDLLFAKTPLAFDLAMLITRVTFGVCFIIHGLGKLGLVGTGNMAGFTQWLKSLKVPYPAVQARIAMLSEILCGSLLILGLLTRPACIVLFFTMLVATFLGHKGAGYLITNNPPGKEYALNLMILQIIIFLLGPGQFSLDNMWF